MRRFLNFDCEGVQLAATLDDGAKDCGLLIVSGGNEIRVGAHRGMAALAADISREGYPVFRFDRRGIGDSEGENSGFEGSGPDLQAAVSAFSAACPHVKRLVAYGNCDGASALLLHTPKGIDGLILSNIWVVEPVDELPPPAAIKAHYLQRMRDPKAWIGLFSGAINLRKLSAGLARLSEKPRPSALADRIANAMRNCSIKGTILLAKRDGTALAFAEAWRSEAFAPARNTGRFRVTEYDSSAHSFARAADYEILRSAVLERLGGC